MTEDEQRLFAGVLPLDDVESGAIELAGRVAELLDRLHAAVDALTDPKPVDDWAAALAAAADALTETTAAATPGSAPSSSACSTTSSPRRPATRPRSRSRRSARCSPTACADARRARTSAPAT